MSSFDPVSLGLLGGGSIASAIGGVLGADSSRKRANTAEDRNIQFLTAAQHGQGLQMYGNPYINYINQLYGAAWKSGNRGDQSGYTSPEFLKAQEEFNKVTGGPILPQVQKISRQAIADDRNRLAQFDTETGQFAARNRSLESLVGNYGAGREAVIREDSARSLKDANRTALGRLTASGLGGSTAAVSALNSNATDNLRETNRSLADLAASKTQMMSAAKGQGISNDMARSLSGLNLWNIVKDRRLDLKMRPINLQLEAQRNSIQNPGAPGSTPVPSGSATAFTNLGNTAAQFGSLLLAKNLFGDAPYSARAGA